MRSPRLLKHRMVLKSKLPNSPNMKLRSMKIIFTMTLNRKLQIKLGLMFMTNKTIGRMSMTTCPMSVVRVISPQLKLNNMNMKRDMKKGNMALMVRNTTNPKSMITILPMNMIQRSRRRNRLPLLLLCLEPTWKTNSNILVNPPMRLT